MIAVDTNILVYAHRIDSKWHGPARMALGRLNEGRARWAMPWPCVHRFLAIVTHPRIYAPPTPWQQATDQVDAWIESPGVVPIGEPPNYWAHLRSLVAAGQTVGPRVHDTRIVAICLAHGVRELWSADRDFSRFAGLTVFNPLLS